MSFLANLFGGSSGSASSTPAPVQPAGNAALQFGQTAENTQLSPSGVDLEALFPGLSGINPADYSTIASNLSSGTAPTAQSSAAALPAPSTPPNPSDSGIMTSVDADLGGGGY